MVFAWMMLKMLMMLTEQGEKMQAARPMARADPVHFACKSVMFKSWKNHSQWND